MSLDATEVTLATVGVVEISADGWVTCNGFSAEGGSCRDVATLAVAHAIGVLQRELLANIERPGGGKICIG